MPKHKKIDKKKAVTFQLVHRSQQDPLIADDEAPQRVLVPIEESKKSKEKRVEEQHKYGIYYDDDCNYLQHLKERSDNTMQWPDDVEDKIEKVKAKLPSKVFASEAEEDVGLLAKAAPTFGPQLHLDPDVVAAMDEDFDYDDPDNQLEDDFVELALGAVSDEEFREEDECDSNFDDEMGSETSFDKEETKSRFTNYSMTSSVMRRNDQLTLLDERFEKMYAGYEENEIGALDCEEIEGFISHNSDVLLKYAEDFEKNQKREQIDQNKIKQHLRLEESESEDDNDTEYITVPEKEKWDCESILTTYSNIYNHPKLIKTNDKIDINKKTGLPKNVLGTNKLTAAALDKLNRENDNCGFESGKSVGGQSIISQLSMLSIRRKDESAEERKERKKKLKEYRKERRIEKKLNAVAFKEEANKQVKISINNRNNVQGNKIL